MMTQKSEEGSETLSAKQSGKTYMQQIAQTTDKRKKYRKKKKLLSPISRLMTIFTDKSKKTGKVKCPMFKKEVFSNAKTTLKNCDSLAEFNSRTYLQETLCRSQSKTQMFTPTHEAPVFPAREKQNRKFR